MNKNNIMSDKSKNAQVAVVTEEETTEGKTELYYEFTAENGDVHVHISVGRHSHVRVMSGQPQPPPKPPGT